MKNFVISLKSATERRKHINNEFGKHNINFEFFDALTPDTAKSYAQSLGLNLDDASLTSGELACMMSHVAIWKKSIDESIPYITVFEDDVYLGEDAEALLNTTYWIKSNWHIIKIEAFAKKALLSNKRNLILSGKRQVRQLMGKNLGAAGYILSTKGAKLYFDFLSNSHLQPIDEIIFDIFIENNVEPVYQLTPAICAQEMILKEHKQSLIFPSSLEKERKQRMKAEKKKGLAKLKRELSRIAFQAKEGMFAKEITFE
ncbi:MULTISPECIES: glycosyltransferase family 25 protein [unclassified Psychrobacter]|uniref:glycosyltransferase family 25 protein n=1 Tax=unclassified Psychrobacter TaxID=196806 RepID=UPI0025B50BD8|nr:MULTISPECIES: glycosyltransferase family 25 protein [unclassified Psychrobacter]MDN3454577.1 glycosyltransferase family 25 protein [Psychrobacter sp. APC 3350]MDN3503525.1 glycosyltransferase family 25 protein [Psychrobacter sp. 5A.1]